MQKRNLPLTPGLAALLAPFRTGITDAVAFEHAMDARLAHAWERRPDREEP